MRPLVPVLAAISLAAAVGPATAPAVAAGETCLGQPATVVGSSQTLSLVGTEGPDVILSNGANQVRGLAGDDLICVTGFGAQVWAGEGNDVVDGSTLTGSYGPQARLGAGSDRFVGSPGFDVVWAGSPVEGTPDHTDAEADVIDTGAAPSRWAKDMVFSGQPGAANGDSIRMSRGSLTWDGLATAGSAIDGGAGSTLVLDVDSAGSVAIDNSRETLRIDDRPTLQFTGITGFSLSAWSAPVRLSFRGDDRSETLGLEGWRSGKHTISMGGGADRLQIYSSGPVAIPAGSAYVGGSGRDRLGLTLPQEADVDLHLLEGTLATGRRGSEVEVQARSFEDATVMAADVEVVGTSGGNEIQVYACRSTVRGGRGRDLLSTFDEVMDEGLDCRRPHARFDGGSGTDTLTGSTGPDRLIGGPGRDKIDGSSGRDTCQAEKVRRCEVKLL